MVPLDKKLRKWPVVLRHLWHNLKIKEAPFQNHVTQWSSSRRTMLTKATRSGVVADDLPFENNGSFGSSKVRKMHWSSWPSLFQVWLNFLSCKLSTLSKTDRRIKKDLRLAEVALLRLEWIVYWFMTGKQASRNKMNHACFPLIILAVVITFQT